jgi:hypothetical protein
LAVAPVNPPELRPQPDAELTFRRLTWANRNARSGRPFFPTYRAHLQPFTVFTAGLEVHQRAREARKRSSAMA